MILDAYSETAPKKVMKDSIEKCGFESYRLLNREYDPMNPDTEGLLMQHIYALAKMTCKSVNEEHAALREAAVRIQEYERRSKHTLEKSEDEMLAGMFFSPTY